MSTENLNAVIPSMDKNLMLNEIILSLSMHTIETNQITAVVGGTGTLTLREIVVVGNGRNGTVRDMVERLGSQLHYLSQFLALELQLNISMELRSPCRQS